MRQPAVPTASSTAPMTRAACGGVGAHPVHCRAQDALMTARGIDVESLSDGVGFEVGNPVERHRAELVVEQDRCVDGSHTRAQVQSARGRECRCGTESGR